MIKIRIRKVVMGNVRYVKILGINMMEKSRLPSGYFNDYPYCFMGNEGKKIIIRSENDNYRILHIGSVYTKQYFEESKKEIFKAGTRLENINKELK